MRYIASIQDRKPYIAAVSALYALTPRECDLVLALDAICESAGDNQDCALALRLFGGELTEKVKAAGVMVLIQRAQYLFEDMPEHYPRLLREACLQVDEVNGVCDGFRLSQRTELYQHYARAWLKGFKQTSAPDAYIDDIEPLLERSPELISFIAEAMTQRLLHPRLQAHLLAYYQQPSPTDTVDRRPALAVEQIKEAATDQDLIALAGSPHGSEAVLTYLDDSHDTPNAMIEAYIEALFSWQSWIRASNDTQAIPPGIKMHAQAFTERFLERLAAENANGRWFLYRDQLAPVYGLLLRHAPNPEAVVRLHLGSGLASRNERGEIAEWHSHPLRLIQDHFKANPPAPGELGPALRPLLKLIANGHSPHVNVNSNRGPSALGMVHQFRSYEGMNPSQLLNKSLIRLLANKRYCEDLEYPVDQSSCVIDHLPNLMEHLRVYCHSLVTTPKQQQVLHTQLAEINDKLKQQEERILKRRTPVQDAAEVLTEVAPADVL